MRTSVQTSPHPHLPSPLALFTRTSPCGCTRAAPARACPQATLAAANVAGILSGYPVWNKADILGFVDKPLAAAPHAAPSIVNAKELKLKVVE